MDDGKLQMETGSRHAVPPTCGQADVATQMDVHRMLAYAAGKRAITLDETVAREAVAVTGMPVATMTPDERLTLYRVHDTLAAAIAPATPDGVRTLDAYQRFRIRDRRSRAVFGATAWAVGGLALAMIIHAYVATGSLIVRSIETTRTDAAQLQSQVRAFDSAHPGSAVGADNPAALDPSRMNERDRLKADATSVNRRNDTAHDRLTGWLYVPLGVLAKLDLHEAFGLEKRECGADQVALQLWALAKGERAADPTDLEAKRQAAVKHCGESARLLVNYDDAKLTEAYYKAREAHQQNARATMEVFSVVVLPLVFGLLGASIAVLRDVNRRLHEGSLDLTTLRCAAMRRVLGSAVGGIVGIFFTPTHVLENWGLSLVALAFLLGFSVDVAFRVFQGFTDRIGDAIGGGADKSEPARR